MCFRTLAVVLFAVVGAISEDSLSLLQTSVSANIGKPTAHDVNECYREAEVLDFPTSQLSNNNLGGSGPDSAGHKTIHYKGIALVEGQLVDLIITTDDSYKPNNPKMNGFGGDDAFGAVNLFKGTAVPMTFNFVLSGTNKPFKFKEFYLSFYDIDHEDVESLTLSDFDSYHLVDSHEIKVADEGNGATSFTATAWGNGENNPTTPDELTDSQLQHSFTVLYSDKSEITVTASAKNGGGGRNFYFGGTSVACHHLSKCLHGPEVLDFTGSNLVQNNLGGQGPDSGQEVIHFKHIAKYKGVVVDLIISTEHSYKSNNPKMNGYGGDDAFGAVNLYKGTDVPMTFSFVDQDGKLVVLDEFYLSFYDIDHEDVESITLSEFDSYHLVDGHNIRVEPTEDDRTSFTATEFGSGKNNPKSPDSLTAAQLTHSFTVLYTKKSEISVHAGAKLGGGGRNFYFSGKNILCAEYHDDSNLARIALHQ